MQERRDATEREKNKGLQKKSKLLHFSPESPGALPPLGGALSPPGLSPLWAEHLVPRAKKETILINLPCYLPFLTYLFWFVVLDCYIFLCQA